MNVIKRHKNLAIIGSLTIILIIVMIIICGRMIFTTGESEYGKRLNGLMKIEKEVTNEIIEKTKENKEVEDITIRIQGKIVYTTIIYKKGTKADTAKNIAAKTLEKYGDEILSYYDFAFFVKENKEATSETDTNGFVLAGTKHPNIETISWTK